MKFKVGDNVRHKHWEHKYLEILCIGKQQFFARDGNGFESSWNLDDVEFFEIYTPPKKKVTKWLWADFFGNGFWGFHHDEPKGFPIKLEWSATEFEEGE